MPEANDEKILKEAKARYALSVEADSENRRQFEEDIDFYSGETQWNKSVLKARELENRPCLTVNRLPQFVRQVVNDYRQNKVSIKVRAVDDYADPETAEVIQGLIRHIESNSNADIAYENAFFYAVAGGFGFYRVVTEYVEGSFEQDIFIKPIPNSLTVRFDPDGRALDGSDWQWCFIEEEIDRKRFEDLYPDVDCANWSTDGDYTADWHNKDVVRVAEYFEYQDEPATLLRLVDGTVMYKDEYEKLEEKPEIDSQRSTTRRKVMWHKLAGESVIESKEWAGKYIPVVPIFGDVLEVKGRRKYLSLIRFAKDAQMMLNYFRSTEVELLALQPKAPFIAAEGQTEGYESEWETANQVPYSVLTYKPTTIDGIAVPPPQRQPFPSVPTGALQGALNAEQDMMNTTGIHEAGLGIRSNESSGRAILARQREGDVATFHFIDNASRAQRQCGRILVDLIPKIYDTPRVVRILGDDDSEQITAVNQPVMMREKGQEIQKMYDLGVGRYDVTVSSGASYTTRRQEAADAMMEISRANPALWQFAPDLMVKAMDWPDADTLAERLKKTLPPDLLDGDDEEQKAPIDPQMQMQLEQMQAQLEQAGQMVQELQAQADDKVAKLQLDAKKLQIEQFKAETERMKAELDAQIKLSQLPDNRADELSDADAEKLNYEAELKALLQRQEFEHQKEMEILRFQLQKSSNNDMAKRLNEIEAIVANMCKKEMADDIKDAGCVVIQSD